MKCHILRGGGGNLVHLQSMYKARCPESRQALFIGKDFHIHSERPVLISILMHSPFRAENGEWLFAPSSSVRATTFSLMGPWWSRDIYLSQGNLACPSEERASVGWLDSLLFHKDINNIQGVIRVANLTVLNINVNAVRHLILLLRAFTGQLRRFSDAFYGAEEASEQSCCEITSHPPEML